MERRSQAGGSDDDLFQEYPGSVDEARAPKQQDKRFPFAWINAVSVDVPPVGDGVPALAGLRVYALPQPGRVYVVGADCAEGNPNSDDSVACVLDAETWEQTACMTGKFEPGTFAGALDQLAAWYNQASVMVERNNHGHAVLLANGDLRPWMLHFAVNRVVGAVRGESDLAPILVWLRRYSGWLEDPEAFGLSVVLSLDRVWVLDGGTEIPWRYGDKPPEGAQLAHPFGGHRLDLHRQRWHGADPGAG